MGTTVCRLHGGMAPQVQAAAKRRLEAQAATADLARMGVSIETTPIEALEAMLFEAAGNVVVLRELAAAMDKPLAVEQGPGGAKKLVHHPLVTLYNEERDRLARLSEACIKLGLDERRVNLAENHVERLFKAVTGALATLPPELAGTFRTALAGELRKMTLVA